MQQRFRVFLESKWEPSSDDAYFKSEGKSIALNFFDFAIEVRGRYQCYFPSPS
jgi:hypothetical protein